MKKTVFYFSLNIIFVLISFSSFSQVPGIKWQKSLGGTSEDAFYDDTTINSITKMPILVNNNGYILAASSYSNDGDVSGNHGSYDFWIVRLDTARNIMWQKPFGGSADEEINELQHAINGNYIAGGIAFSNNGNVSGRKDALQGDGWLVRISGDGNLIWQKCLGGTLRDEVKSVKPTADNGFILLCNTNSNDLDVSGNHGEQDLWVVKVNALGDIQWQKCLGGSGVEAAGELITTSDGGYLVVGSTMSNDGDVGANYGQKDMWVVKLNAAGNIIWGKNFGGTNDDAGASVKETLDGGYFIGGYSFSNNGDATGNHGYADAWVLKIDANGDKLWQKCLGGDGAEGIMNAERTADGGFIIGGYTWSNNEDVSGNHGGRDAWIAKLNSTGDLQWQKCLGGTSYDGAYGILPTSENEYLVAGSVLSNNGDVSGNHGGTDLWLVQLGAVNTLKGLIFYDQNSNGNYDAGDKLTNNAIVTASKGGVEISAFPFGGKFIIEVDTGSYTTTSTPVLPYYTVVPSTISSTFNTYLNTDSFSFALQPIAGKKDLLVSLLPLTTARPGFNANYQLIYKNAGTEPIVSGTVQLVKDSRTDFISASITPSNITGDTLRWDYSNLEPLDSISIDITLKLKAPPVTNVFDIIKHIATINPVTNDLTPADDTSVLRQGVRGALDPNDKIENNNGIITEGQISNGEYLNYVIRFQNTGTDTAFNVVIRDTLDTNLDWSSLQMVSSSHTYQLSVAGGNKCAWSFNNIELPDSFVNEALSHGYIAYRIKPKNTLVVGDIIYNDASIYFDYNLPELTNIQQTEVGILSTLPVGLLDFSAKLNSDKNVSISWETSWEENADFFEIERSNGTGFSLLQKVGAKNLAQGANYSIEDGNPFGGMNYYRLRMVDIDGSYTYSKIVQIKLPETALTVQINPNPNYGEFNIKLTGQLKGFLSINIYDMTGKKIDDTMGGYVSGNSYFMPVTLTALPAGIYIAKIQVGSFIRHYKFVLRSK